MVISVGLSHKMGKVVREAECYICFFDSKEDDSFVKKAEMIRSNLPGNSMCYEPYF